MQTNTQKPNPFIFHLQTNRVDASKRTERRIFRSCAYLAITATIISNLYYAFAATKQPLDLNVVGSSQSGVQRISSHSKDRPLLQRAPKVERPSDDQLTPRDRLTHNIDGDSEASCTANQLETIMKQLPADDCEANSHKPWCQKCSFTYATKCPDSVWLEDYYNELHSNEHTAGQTNNTFVGIFVGCNKGFDAVNALRMGSGNNFFTKDSWKEAMVNNSGVKEGDVGVCNQVNSPQFYLKQNSTAKPNPLVAQLHCIEPVPETYLSLSRSAQHLQYFHNGFIAVHAAISNRDGSVAIPNTQSGAENKGIASCNSEKSKQSCVTVPMYSLDTYVNMVVSKLNPHGPINYLSIDTEGSDMDVILGGQGALNRVEYLEFEYNWVGSWRNQLLSDLIRTLDEEFGFTCYWPGFNNNIWRITGCWLDHYDLHFWSNVACVNRRMDGAKVIAERMEKMFLDTIKKGDEIVMNYTNRYQF